ncbi:VanZ family protein [Haladaptatus caseinilyticus]|uniref:VanZ family protein n=1 Tax=Haladaptatus caseinilyticus TaxID=2993314 RepID=UPI00224B1863|nr:VanZ family protein [Haladaptatus caseinilyticus]
MAALRHRGLSTDWLLALILAVGICYFSVFSTPDAGVSSLGPLGLVGMDKWYHAVGYGALGALLAIAMSNDDRMATSVVFIALMAIAGATGYGILMEIAQAFVPVRHTGIGDVIADAVGASLAVGIWWVTVRWLAAR